MVNPSVLAVLRLTTVSYFVAASTGRSAGFSPLPNFDTSLWLGLIGPAGLPRPIVDKLAGPAQKAMQAPESALVKQGYDSHFLGPDQFAAFIAREKTRWSEVARAAGLLSKS